jgi:CubicO group peptidase (beta-lactamase class C family)
MQQPIKNQLRLTLLLTLSVLLTRAQPADLPPGLDQYIDRVLKVFEVPGMSISIVHKGKVLLSRGYGVRKVGYPDPVDAHTLFPIASNSKAFTAVALAMLAEEGKLTWDDPVVEHVPWFRMSDPWVSMQITIRDLLVHHSGIPAFANDILLFPPSTFTRRELVGKVRTIPLVHGFRTTYAYDNILYLAAGEVIEAASGTTWEDFIQQRIFRPLDMSESLSRFSLLKDRSNIAAGHARLDGKVKAIDHFLDDAIGDASDPAGGISSNAGDMSQWMLTLLDSGLAPNKTRLYAAGAVKDLWQVVTPIPTQPAPEELKPAQMNFWGYMLGMRAYNYGACKVIGHGGKLGGFVSQVTLVPQLELGISVLTNQESTGAYWSVIYHVLDYYMHNPSFDWIAGYKKQLDTALAEEKRTIQQKAIQPDPSARASLPLEKYAGRYRDPLCGEATITMDSAGLVLRFGRLPRLTADIRHLQYDTFIARFRDKDLKADAYVSFSLHPDGSIDQVKMKTIDDDSDIGFDEILLKPVK